MQNQTNNLSQMNTKHTPGPWKIVEVTSDTASGPTNYPRAIVAGSVTIAELPERSPLCMMDERAANARLVAAAPELLRVAELAATLNTQTNHIGSGMLTELVARASDAITKATNTSADL